MSVYIYALLGATPRGPLGHGIQGEPLRAVTCGPLVAIVGDMPGAPAPSSAALRDHDAAIRRLATVEEAVLPVRFGSLVTEDGEVARRLEPAEAALTSALALVAGGEQMTLRVYEHGVRRVAARPDTTGLGPGARYLTERRSAHPDAIRSAALGALSAGVAHVIRAERVEVHGAPPLVASLHHLIARGTSPGYRSTVEATQARLDGVTVRVSGPWPPYAFASGESE